MHARSQNSQWTFLPLGVSKMTAALSRPPTVFGSPHTSIPSPPLASQHIAVPVQPSLTNLVLFLFFLLFLVLSSPSPLHQVRSYPSPNPLPPSFLLPSPNLPQFTSPLLPFALLSCRPPTQEACCQKKKRKKPTSTSKPPVSTRQDRRERNR